METVAAEWCEQLLATLSTRVGEAGLAATRLDARLRTDVGRHEAEVRAWFDGQAVTVSRQSIAGYAAVLLAAAQRCGRLLPPDPASHDWASAEWYLLRLLALCSMAAAAQG
jgi:hypothetical protein